MRDFRFPLTPRRSLFGSGIEVAIRGFVWALILVLVIPVVLQAGQALGEIQPGPPRAGQLPFWNTVRNFYPPQRFLPILAAWLGCVDLPMTYAMSNSIEARKNWSRLMWMPPVLLGIGLVLGFFYSYVQTIGGMMQGMPGV